MAWLEVGSAVTAVVTAVIGASGMAAALVEARLKLAFEASAFAAFAAPIDGAD